MKKSEITKDMAVDYKVDSKNKNIPGTGRVLIAAEECGEESMFGTKCIGVKGHKHNHWHYTPTGAYHWWTNDNDKDPKEDMAAGTCPAGHDNYVHPCDREDDTCGSYHRWEKIEEDE